ncbi:unnamed protein product [marine sediment metagenome]|uniref:Uncharacterized protein n=1 Tax=marine sediment metagenome TaxID=412755 RepID=X1F115_9ZZZZ
MECEKCQDRGFTEQEHGLIMVLCDCEKGKAMMEELTGEATFPADNGVVNDSNSGTGQTNNITRSKDTSQSKRTRKPKKKKGTRKRAS